MKEKEKAAKESKKFHLELSRTALFFWSLGFLIFLGWIFTLGVLAGRGLLPSGAKTMAEIKNQIVRLQEMMGQKRKSELDEIKAVQKAPNFAFYDELSSKKAPTVSVKKKRQSPVPKVSAVNHLKKVEKPSATALYVVQVASLDKEKQALRMVKRLVKKGYPAYHYKVFVKGRSYFRVRCGTFKTRSDAAKTQQKLAEKEHMKGFVQKVEKPL